MKPENQIPYYAPDGTSLGFRSTDAAKRLIEGGYVKPSYGRVLSVSLRDVLQQ
jgi:hypothetical protein